MLSIYQLMKYLREKHNIEVKSNQTQDLRNIGYYHGFKGYRFIRNDENKIYFSSLKEVIALNKFDMELKSILYPKVMFIETAIKNYAIESLLKDSKSENFETIYNKSLTEHREHSGGSKKYKKSFLKRMRLKGKINNALIRDYGKRSVVSHFFDKDKNIPIWAIFETISLGEFGSLLSCSNKDVRVYVSKIINLPANLDLDGKLSVLFIFAMKDLRNAIAHNNVIFDTRFKTGKVNKRLTSLLEKEIGVSEINFDYIDAYIILIAYFLRKVGESKTVCKRFIKKYVDLSEQARKEIPYDIYKQIFESQHKNNMNCIKEFIRLS